MLFPLWWSAEVKCNYSRRHALTTTKPSEKTPFQSKQKGELALFCWYLPLFPPRYIPLHLIYNYLDLSHNLREREITTETLRSHVAWIWSPHLNKTTYLSNAGCTGSCHLLTYVLWLYSTRQVPSSKIWHVEIVKSIWKCKFYRVCSYPDVHRGI